MMKGNINRVPTGVSGLDELIGGGFPRGSLIVLAGNPGTGKTIFSATFIYNGIVNYGERGIYVSFAENREAFLGNMLSLGLDFEKLEEEGMFRFLDMVTAREEAAPTLMETVLREVSGFGAKRLVIDSFSALAQAFKEAHEARIILHTILSRVTRLMGCTTILIVENPHGGERIGLGIEEFVADGIITLKMTELDEKILRVLEIFKMRGTPIPEKRLIFTLKNGFKAFPPFKPKRVEEPRRFEPQPDTEEYFSTGSPSLDEIIGGGYPRGSTVLLELDPRITTLQYYLVLAPTAYNFAAQGRGIIIIPTRGTDHNLIARFADMGGFTKEEINRILRVFVKEYPTLKPEPWIVAFKGESIEEYFAKHIEAEGELIKNAGMPILSIIGTDTLIDLYGVRGALIALRTRATGAREMGGLCIITLRPGHPRLTKILSAAAETHLILTRKHGSALLYGVKPRTNLHVLEMDASKGYPMPKLTPII
ncbi:MAG: ATPase domain-containing protein [Candidatus Bathyarchaeia archaeon]